MTQAKPLPSQAELKELFDYDPETGKLNWRKPPKRSKSKPGDEAGCLHRGYRLVGLRQSLYKVHRLIWMWVYGEDPIDKQIDHINGQRNDNRISNLRLVNQQQNNWNYTQALGYSFSKKENKWVAYIGKDGKLSRIGSFDCPLLARLAYLDAKQQLHTI